MKRKSKPDEFITDCPDCQSERADDLAYAIRLLGSDPVQKNLHRLGALGASDVREALATLRGLAQRTKEQSS